MTKQNDGQEPVALLEPMRLSSSAFENEGTVPGTYTCRGRNISPPLAFENPPAGTESYALIMEDLDTPVGTVTHWVAYNIPADTDGLAEGIPGDRLLTNGGSQGRNGMFRIGYMGPCPPWGRHRYLFRLFALDAMIDPGQGSNKRRLLRAMEFHILAQARLLGYYSRKRRRK